MVLLTASTISAAISGAIICLFTFLLFLSGYVLQQQTVRSLQDALSAPIESRVRIQAPIPFSPKELIVPIQNANDTVPPIAQILLEQTDGSQAPSTEPTPKDLWHAHLGVPPSFTPSNPSTTVLLDAADGRFAYVLALSSPSDLCSALLFTHQQRSQSLLSRQQVNIVYLYPSDWETSTHTIYSAALRLLIHSEHEYAVLLHPVPISKIWTGIDVESQLLSELARNPWPYDRVVYVRSPGMLLDVAKMDETLVSTYAETRLLKTEWVRLRAPVRRGAPAQLHPDMLLFAQGKGLMVPIAGLEKSLAAKVILDEREPSVEEYEARILEREAAYVLFDTEEVARARKSSRGEGGIFERFERDRGSMCEGTDLLAS